MQAIVWNLLEDWLSRCNCKLGILAEAGLSYVGLGAQPPTPSWGRMLADAQTLVAIAPHMALIPGFAIILTVLGLNLLGDGMRDYFDPKLRVSRA